MDLLEIRGAARLHIGGTQPVEGWKILNISQKPGVDYVGDVRDLSQFNDDSFDAVYASHVLEHLGYQRELSAVLSAICRILRPAGKFFVSVPDLNTLCRLFLHQQLTKQDRFEIMRMMFGGQVDEHDYHFVGLTDEFLADFLSQAGFKEIYRVPEFKFFNDMSSLRFGGVPISVNLVALK